MRRTALLTLVLAVSLAPMAAGAQDAPPQSTVEVEPPSLEGWPEEPQPPPAQAAPPAAAPQPQPRSAYRPWFARPARQAAPPPVAPPPPDPNDWWSSGEPDVPDARDPLHGRRVSRQEQARAPQISSNADPLLYRLWGLQPLHIQAVRANEVIVEVWVRPQNTVRQAVIRATVREDGRAFVQARAGLGCCAPEVGRRVDIDEPLAPGYAAALRGLAEDPAWKQPENVTVDEGGGAVEGICVGGISYDLVLVERDRATHLRRACAGPELGSVADILSLVIGSALGKDRRFDVVFPRGADFSSHKAAYAELLASGGRLLPRRSS